MTASNTMAETSTKPYMIRALHEWCTDNGYTPQIVVRVDAGTIVPRAHVKEGQITLNIGLLATKGLTLGNDTIEFQARFNGVTENIYIPVAAVTALYARETGAGMGFEVEAPHENDGARANLTTTVLAAEASPADKTNGAAPPSAPAAESVSPLRPKLTIVK